MSINKSYIGFILDNFINSKMKIDIPEPQGSGSIRWETGPSLFMEININSYTIYNKSVKFILSFDKYETEVLIYMPLNKSPNEILHRIHHQFSRSVYNTFINDGRKEDLIKLYSDLRKDFFSGIKLKFNNGTDG